MFAIAALVFALSASVQDTIRHPIVIVVRHAEKASQTDRDPALSEAGVIRAAALDSVLQHARVAAVIVTPFRRTIETAAPVATRYLLTPIVIPVEGGVAAHAYAVAQAARRFDGVVLVVGHSNTVLPIVRALGGPTLPDLCDSSYAQIFTVTVAADRSGRMIRSGYGAPDPAGPTLCPELPRQ